MVFILLGLIFIIYFSIIAFHTGLNSKFPIIWIALGIMLGIHGFVQVSVWADEIVIPDIIIQIFRILIFITGIIYIFIQSKIFEQFYKKAPKGLPYIIILGAQMKLRGPSRALKRRLDCAIKYLKENKETIVILSGGQGSNEPMSEADGMEKYLLEKGMDRERIRKEDKSVNTYQNLLFSRQKYLEEKEEQIQIPVGIVTSNYHVFRALKIAKKIKLQKVYGISADSETFMLLNNSTREVCAIIKDYLVRNI